MAGNGGERGLSRRDLLGTGLAGAAAGSLLGPSLASARPARSAAGKGEYVIGCSFPLTGGLASDGQQMKNGVTLAADEINSLGGVAGKQIKLDIVDTDVSNGAKIKATLTKHINNKVDALYEGYFLDWASALDIKGNYGAPALNASTSIAQVQKIQANPRYANIIQIDPPESWYGLGYPVFLNSIVKTSKWKPQNHDIFIVQGDSVYSQTISKFAQQAAKKYGWKVVGVKQVTTGAADWSPPAKAAKDSKAAAVMVTHFPPDDLAKFTKAWAANPGHALLYLQYGPSIPSYLQLAGKAANGIVWATTTGVYNDDIGLGFQKRYQAKFHQPAGFSNSGSGYDSVYMFANAWGLVGDARNFKAVAGAIKRNIHRGVNGAYWLHKQTGLAYPDQTKDPSIAQAHLFFQIQDGKQIIIEPQPYVDAAFQLPPWL